MTIVNRSALVHYSADEMYRLVVDVDSYAEFVPWCAGSETLSLQGDEQIARILIAKGPVRKSFTTRNRLIPGESIEISLIEGPFESLGGRWGFDSLQPCASRVSLDMEFHFLNGIVRRLIEPVFNEIAGKMVDAFCARAEKVYGKR